MKEVGKQVMWGLVIEPAPEGPPLVPIMGAQNEEIGTMPVQEDGAMADDNAVE